MVQNIHNIYRYGEKMVGVEIKFESKNYYNKEGTKPQKKSVLTHMFVYLYCLKSSLVNPLS